MQCVAISHVTIYDWIAKYFKMIDQYMGKFTPEVGNKCCADEVFLEVKDKKKYLYTLMYDDARFWIF